MIDQAKLEVFRQEEWSKYAPEAQSLLSAGEQLVGVTVVRLHQQLKEPPRQYLDHPKSRGWGAVGVLADTALGVLTGGATGSNASSSQKGISDGGWESEAGRLRISAWNTPKGYSGARFRVIVTDRRVIVCPERDAYASNDSPLPVIGEYPRGGTGVHARRQKVRGDDAVNFVFGDGSWFCLSTMLKDANSNELFAQLVGEG